MKYKLVRPPCWRSRPWSWRSPHRHHRHTPPSGARGCGRSRDLADRRVGHPAAHDDAVLKWDRATAERNPGVPEADGADRRLPGVRRAVHRHLRRLGCLRPGRQGHPERRPLAADHGQHQCQQDRGDQLRRLPHVERPVPPAQFPCVPVGCPTDGTATYLTPTSCCASKASTPATPRGQPDGHGGHPGRGRQPGRPGRAQSPPQRRLQPAQRLRRHHRLPAGQHLEPGNDPGAGSRCACRSPRRATRARAARARSKRRSPRSGARSSRSRPRRRRTTSQVRQRIRAAPTAPPTSRRPCRTPPT